MMLLTSRKLACLKYGCRAIQISSQLAVEPIERQQTKTEKENVQIFKRDKNVIKETNTTVNMKAQTH